MAKAKKVLSTVLVALFTVFTVLSYVPAKAAAGPTVKMVAQPQAEYKVGDKVTIKFNAGTYKGNVQYRVFLWQVGKGNVGELYSAYAKAGYFGKAVKGTQTVTVSNFTVKEAGQYYFAVFVKANNANKATAKYVYSARFVVKAEEEKPAEVTIKELVNPADITVNEGEKVTLPETVKAKMSDGTEKEVAVKWDTTVDTTKPGEYTVNGTVEGTTLKPAVKVVVKEVAPQVKDVAATGAKVFKVTFTKAVDTTKVNFAVKKNNIAVNISSVAWDDAKTVATVTMAGKLTAGDYVVTVGGVVDNYSKTITVTDEKVAKIEFPSTVAVMDASTTSAVTFTVKVYNQYNEDITANTTLVNSTAITFTASKGNYDYTDLNNGILKLTVSTNFTLDEKIAVTAVDRATGTFASGVVTVSNKADVAEITITNLYNKDGKTLSAETNLTTDKFYLLVEAKDQYGNTATAAQLNSGLVLSISNPAVINVNGGVDHPSFETVTLADGTKKLGIQLVAPSAGLSAGTAKIFMISKTTGKSSSFDVTVKEGVKVDTLTLNAPDLVVAGESFSIPFTAVDQFGANVTDIAKLQAVNTTSGSITASFVKDYVKNTISLTGTAPATKGVYMFLATTPTGKLAQLAINVVEAAKPVVISGLKDVTPATTVGGTVKITPANIVAVDQYGRTMKSVTLGSTNYKYVVSTSDDTIVQLQQGTTTGTSFDITTASDQVTLKGLTKGTANVTIKLMRWDSTLTTPAFVAVSGSDYTFSVPVSEKADYVNYEASAAGKILVRSSEDENYKVALNVYGVKADGTKVLLPYSSAYYTVTPVNTTAVGVDGNGKLYSTSSAGVIASDAKEGTTTVIVTVNAANGAVVLPVTVTLTNETPVVKTLYVDSDDVDHFVDASTIKVNASEVSSTTPSAINNVIANVVKADDQYGVTLTSNNVVSIIVTNVPSTATYKVSGSDQYIIGLTSGDTFNVTVITNNGVVKTFKFIVK